MDFYERGMIPPAPAANALLYGDPVTTRPPPRLSLFAAKPQPLLRAGRQAAGSGGVCIPKNVLVSRPTLYCGAPDRPQIRCCDALTPTLQWCGEVPLVGANMSVWTCTDEVRV
jgi:hypothetical protein